ncbi:hypothetical protein D0Z00_003679 [Geotrichum galactomycetum]|uniref:Uncharacterized protein n=1 Tax=Geotrichum galactomycetum TaxID=27317 RepID=A0ACB6V0P9_9ASCO|nr:hypothetical protein D0Z00_003679 [Geotrichum candidum]
MATNSELSDFTSDDWGFSVFGLEHGLKVAEAYDPVPEAGVNLLAIGNMSDLLVVGSNNIITSAQLSAVRKAANARETDLLNSKDSVLFQSAPLDGNVLFNSFAGNAIKLDAVFSEANPIVSLLARPQHSNEILILTKSGDVYLLDVNSLNNAQKLASSVVAISWSPQGKAFLAGTSTRELIQYKVDGSVFAKYSLPEDIEDDFNIFSVYWKYSSKLSVTTYNGDDAFKFSLVAVTKSDGSSTWLTSEEVSQPFGDTTRYPFSYNILLKDYDPSIQFFVATSSQSSELSLLSDDSILLPTEDSARAELPIGEDDSDVSPTGIALDFSSDILVPDVLKGFEDDVTVPIVWVFDNTGSLLSWNIAYRKGIKEETSKLENLRNSFEAASEDSANTVSLFASSSSDSTKAPSPFSKTTPAGFASTQSSFGQSPAFGQSSTLSASSSTETNSAFGKSSFAKFVPASKDSSSQSAFGQSSFGKSSFGQSGFGQNTFSPKSDTNTSMASSNTPASAFGTFSSSGSAFASQNQSTSSPFAAASTTSSPFATATSTTGSPFATAPAGKSSDSPFGSARTPSPFGTGSPTTGTTTSIFNAGSNKSPFGTKPTSAFGLGSTSGSVFGGNNNDNAGSVFGSNKNTTSIFGANKNSTNIFSAGTPSANDDDKEDEEDMNDEDEAWVDDEDFEDDKKDSFGKTAPSFSSFKSNDTKQVLNQNKPLSLFTNDQLNSNPFGSSTGGFPSMGGLSIKDSSKSLFGSANVKAEKNFSKSIAESAPLPPDPIKSVAESAPLPPDPVKSVAESAPLPPDPVKSVTESAPLPPDPTSPKKEAKTKNLDFSPGSSSSSSGVLVSASSSPDSDAVEANKSPKNSKDGLFSTDAIPKKSASSGFTSIHDTSSKIPKSTGLVSMHGSDTAKPDNILEDRTIKTTNEFEALESLEDGDKNQVSLEEIKISEPTNVSKPSEEPENLEAEPKDDTASFNNVLDDINDPYVKAYLKKKLTKDLSEADIQVLKEHDVPPSEYSEFSAQFPEPQTYTVEDYFYEPVKIQDPDSDHELASYKQYTVPKYYAFDPSLIPAAGDSYESEAINLFREINAHYEILALNSKAISRVIGLNKPDVDEDGVQVEREARTEDDLDRFNDWKVSEAGEIKALWEPIKSEVDELKKSLDIKIDEKIEKSLTKMNSDLAEIKNAIQYHETFLTDEHISLGGLPPQAALAQKELRTNLKKVKDELSAAEQKVAAVKSASNGGSVTINSLQNFIQKLSLGILKQHDIVEDIIERLRYFQIHGGPNRSLLMGTDNKSLLVADESNITLTFFEGNDTSVLTRRKAVLDSERVDIVEYKRRQLARKKLSQTLKTRDLQTLINTKTTLRGSKK